MSPKVPLEIPRTRHSSRLGVAAAIASAAALSCGGTTVGQEGTSGVAAAGGESAGGGGTGATGGAAGAVAGGGQSFGPGGASAGGNASGGAASDPEEFCVGVTSVGESIAVDVFVVLDRSSSMVDPLPNGSTTKWDAAVGAIRTFAGGDVVAGIGFGLQYFGLPDACSVSGYATPAVPIAEIPEVGSAVVDSTNTQTPGSLTPTAPALEGALQYAQEHFVANPTRPATVVLVTDGFPTECGVSCGSDADCQASACTAGMCDSTAFLGDLEALAARYAQGDPPVRTFVVGLTRGLDAYGSVAAAGGTGDVILIEGDTLEQDLLDALLRVAGGPLACDYDVPTSSPDFQIDPTKAEVRHTVSATGAEEAIPQLPDQSACATSDGWSFDDNTSPTQVILCPRTCNRLASGTVTVLFGCAP